MEPLLIQLYREFRTPLDRLPYTEPFEQLFAEYRRRGGHLETRAEVWRALCAARKKSELPRIVR